jgi:hypothetical protein
MASNKRGVRNTLTKGGAAGGPGSRALNTPTTYFTGRPSDRVSPGGVNQMGTARGNHVTEQGSSTGRADQTPIFDGSFTRPGQPPLGNAKALDVGGGGPGKGYVQYGQAGTQQQYGSANPGNPTPKRNSFE